MSGNDTPKTLIDQIMALVKDTRERLQSAQEIAQALREQIDQHDQTPRSDCLEGLAGCVRTGLPQDATAPSTSVYCSACGQAISVRVAPADLAALRRRTGSRSDTQ